MTEENCKEAAFLLGLDGGTGFRERQNKPAGCFVNSYGNYAYFNAITDPALTDTSLGSHLHGICTIKGTRDLFFLHFVFKQFNRLTLSDLFCILNF